MADNPFEKQEVNKALASHFASVSRAAHRKYAFSTAWALLAEAGPLAHKGT
ncbi:hypothetical protein [Neorhizobium galegae]|uniref:hypothetical protein n=1 Tax=Neorhizobium galegae TaxID=399 RepID=UPI0012D40A8F|nr:hypothetical protein [Neorhizobium galegae]MCQ1852695.1 hypothetical protein [Neorhizobium galegae]